MRTKLFVILALFAVALSSASPAFAHDWRALKRNRKRASRPLQSALDGGLVAQAALAPVSVGHPSAVPFRGTLTNLPTDSNAGYPSPTAACAAPSCAEIQVDVPSGAKTLYATIRVEPAELLPRAVRDWADGVIHGETIANVASSFTKEVGNERTIPRAEFTLADPKSGKWIIRALSAFSNKTAFDGIVAASADPPLQFQRLGVRQLADQFGTQKLRINVVSVGRTLTKSQVAGLKDNLPDQYRPTVLVKALPDCSSDDNPVTCGLPLNWAQSHFSGTQNPVNGDKAGGAVPYFEPLKFRYDYRFLQASDRWTRDLFSYMRSITKR